VRLSLATLHRQAPAGVWDAASGDKRMVDVPLPEVFRHLKPTAYRRRPDQRPTAAVDSQFNLFGNAENPHEIAPTRLRIAALARPASPEAPPVIDLSETEEPEQEVEEVSAPALHLAVDQDLPAPARLLAPPSELYEPKFMSSRRPRRNTAEPPRSVPADRPPVDHAAHRAALRRLAGADPRSPRGAQRLGPRRFGRLPISLRGWLADASPLPGAKSARGWKPMLERRR